MMKCVNYGEIQYKCEQMLDESVTIPKNDTAVSQFLKPSNRPPQLFRIDLHALLAGHVLDPLFPPTDGFLTLVPSSEVISFGYCLDDWCSLTKHRT